jgi:hypothetical protein
MSFASLSLRRFSCLWQPRWRSGTAGRGNRAQAKHTPHKALPRSQSGDRSSRHRNRLNDAGANAHLEVPGLSMPERPSW